MLRIDIPVKRPRVPPVEKKLPSLSWHLWAIARKFNRNCVYSNTLNVQALYVLPFVPSLIWTMLPHRLWPLLAQSLFSCWVGCVSLRWTQTPIQRLQRRSVYKRISGSSKQQDTWLKSKWHRVTQFWGNTGVTHKPALESYRVTDTREQELLREDGGWDPCMGPTVVFRRHK